MMRVRDIFVTCVAIASLVGCASGNPEPSLVRVGNAARQGSLPPLTSGASGEQTLFVSDLQSGSIRLYPANKKNPQQTGSITDGIDLPINVAVDGQGTLYVANNGNNTVTEYPLGHTTPSVTLTAGLLNPNGIAVDKQGTVYVTSGSYYNGYVLEFPKGSSTPYRQVNGFILPVGLAIDKDGNVYVGDTAYYTPAVWEVPAGTSTPVNLHLQGLKDPPGVAIDPLNNLWIADPARKNVFGFHLGQTTPFVTIVAGLNRPYALGFRADGRLFVSDYAFGSSQESEVVGYRAGKVKPFETIGISGETTSPSGIAVYPRPKLKQ